MDRRQALAQDIIIPDRVNGAALFADISDFTSLRDSPFLDAVPLNRKPAAAWPTEQ